MIRTVAKVLAAAVLTLAVLGPAVSPGSATAQAGVPFAAPGAGHPLGTDALGRDVLTRVLDGGWIVVALAAGATVLATVLGVLVGVTAGLAPGRRAGLLIRVTDVVAIVPAILIMLVFAAGFPGSDLAVLAAVALTTTPFSARVVSAATRTVASSAFVEVARGRGDSGPRVLWHDILPNIAGTVLTDAGIRFVAAVHLTATAGFLGLGRGAPAPNWGRMVQENLSGLALTPLPVLVPALLVAVLAVSVNLLADDVRARR
ncbi:ABC transporter permease [Catenuloplanes indicus]|uniref:Peptide/nickel transport system permease protein n=1 Tax=Catenuloplanes indicus TaxID=137267 RepID=A0AAE3VTD0_9ACTN|nr:ABC transporter permease [Catenuloplanes indicus]MDQ0363548.1 peptide/nickel transport system permease protein [Catenuloplanes indicus]